LTDEIRYRRRGTFQAEMTQENNLQAATISEVVSAISAAVAAFSSWNSLRSARASQAAVRETRRQREIDNARGELALLGNVYDDATAFIEALSLEHRRDPAKVEARREVLRRSTLVAGMAVPSLLGLAAATGPLALSDVDAVLSDLNNQSAALHRIINNAGSAVSPTSSSRD
jgi:hypothetical protein